MNPREKWEALIKKAKKYPEQIRWGQALMCALQSLDAPLYGRIVGSVADCFYTDSKCTAFTVEVLSSWYEAKEAIGG